MISPEKRNKQRIIHIIMACKTIADYACEVEKETFLADSKLQDAILYQLIIIGEAVVHIDNELLDKYPYPWFKIRALRNYAAHEYFNIQMWAIWDVVVIHIPELEILAHKILAEEF